MPKFADKEKKGFFFSIMTVHGNRYTFKWDDKGLSFECEGDYRGYFIKEGNVLWRMSGDAPPKYTMKNDKWEILSHDLFNVVGDLDIVIDGIYYYCPTSADVVLNCRGNLGYTIDGKAYELPELLVGMYKLTWEDAKLMWPILTFRRADSYRCLEMMRNGVIIKSKLRNVLKMQSTRELFDFRVAVDVIECTKLSLNFCQTAKTIPFFKVEDKTHGKKKVVQRWCEYRRKFCIDIFFREFFFIGNCCCCSYVMFDMTSILYPPTVDYSSAVYHVKDARRSAGYRGFKFFPYASRFLKEIRKEDQYSVKIEAIGKQTIRQVVNELVREIYPSENWVAGDCLRGRIESNVKEKKM